MDNPQLIQTIIDRRKELGLTQTQLAELAQISRRTINDLESGNASISLRRLSRIVSALDMTLFIKPGRARPTESELAALFKDDDD